MAAVAIAETRWSVELSSAEECCEVVLAFPLDDAEAGRSSNVLISTVTTWLAPLPAHTVRGLLLAKALD